MIFIAYACCMADDEKWQPIESIGKTGTTVARNIKNLRGRMSYTELAERLIRLDRPIPTLGLRKIESGGRRVDVDDLMALALALDVSPISLLMPKSESGQQPVEITGVGGSVESRRLWRWLQAVEQLIGGPYDEFLTFVARALPPWRQREVDLVESGLGPHITRFVRDRDDYGDD